ncbi:MAG: S-layer homology domain-containing protein [Phormidesmis sp.]
MFGQNSPFFSPTVNTAIALSSTLALGLVVTLPAAAQSKFSDVGDNYWANQYVMSLNEANVISGFPDGTFRPDAQMTRAQFASVLAGAFAQPTIRQPIKFSDVPAGHWAEGAISMAYARGFLSGYPDGTFGLDQPITRLEVLLSLANGLGIEKSGDTAELLKSFADSGQVPAWAAEAIAAATDKGLVVNYPDVRQLNPQRNASRAEIAAIAYQALASRGAVSAIASPYLPVVAGSEGTDRPTGLSTEEALTELENGTAANPTAENPVGETANQGTDEFSELVAILSSNNNTERKAAADALAANGKAAVPELAKALESGNGATRAAAAYALNKIGPDAKEATPTLLEVIKDDDELVRALALSTLTQVGVENDILLNVLIAAVQNESGLVKDIAAESLVNIGGDAVPALGNLLKNKSADRLAKQTAATLIGNINQADELGSEAVRSIIPILTETLDDGDSGVRTAAARALGDFGPLADVAIPALSRSLSGANDSLTQSIIGSLLKIGDQATPTLKEQLNSDNTLTRLYAADAVWRITEDSSEILPTLVAVLSDGDVKNRELAALGLTYLGRQALPAVPAVQSLVNNRDNQRYLTMARLALLILGNRNDAADTLGLLTEPKQVEENSVPAIYEAVSRVWR